MKLKAIRFFAWICVLIVSLSVVASTNQALAQGQKGAISGLITDDSGAVLKGAQITLESPVFTAVSDEQGRFYINDVAAGSYTLTISYVGFAKFQQSISVSGGQTANVAAKLQVESQSESILVTAPRVTGEAEAINIERAADNLVQVIPAEVIRSLPNANMADALGRLPSVTLERDEGEGKYVQVRGLEPRLTNAMIDGVNVPSPEPGVREVKFDSIPADMVESVQVSKTLQPNMEGDGIGGSVNMITKISTNVPTISLGAVGGYTPVIHGRGETEETGTIGYRFGPEKKFGAIIGGSYDWNGRGIDDIEPVPDVATLTSGPPQSWKTAMDLREYQYFRTRWGLAGTADYKLSEASNIYLRAFYSDFHNYGDRFVYSFTDNSPNVVSLNNPSTEGCVPNATNTACTSSVPPSYSAQLRNPDIGVENLVVGGVHNLTTTWFAWDVAASRGWYGNNPYATASFNTLGSSTCQYDPANTANEFLPRWSGSCFQEISNPSNYFLTDLNKSLGPSAQLNIEASGSGAKRYHIGSKLATIEIGARFRNAHKFNEAYTWDAGAACVPTGGAVFCPGGSMPVLMSSFANRMTNHNYYNGGNYNLGYNPSLEDVVSFYNSNPNEFSAPTSTQGADGHDFNLIEKVIAGYFMNTIDLSSRWRLLAGLRIEATRENGSNFIIDEVANTLTSTRFRGSYMTYLPSAALKYAMSPNDNLRFIYARGLSRPDPEQFAQAIDITPGGGNGNAKFSATLDNPGLLAETGDDIDVLYDHYFSTFGVFSAGYFYKYLHNPIVDQLSFDPNFTPPGSTTSNSYDLTKPVNAGHGWVTGVEVAYLQHFSSLPGAWAGLGLSANYGYTASRAIGVPGRSLVHPMLPRTSPNAFNISPTYDRGRVSLRLGVTYNQASIYGYQYQDGTDPNNSTPTPGGLYGPLSDVYFYTHVQVDAQASVRMNHGLSFLVSALNLNNEVFGFYQGSSQYMIQREYYQPTISLGIRWEPPREK